MVGIILIKNSNNNMKTIFRLKRLTDEGRLVNPVSSYGDAIFYWQNQFDSKEEALAYYKECVEKRDIVIIEEIINE